MNWVLGPFEVQTILDDGVVSGRSDSRIELVAQVERWMKEGVGFVLVCKPEVGALIRGLIRQRGTSVTLAEMLAVVSEAQTGGR